MSDDLNQRIGDLLKSRPWYRLPRLLAMGKLIEIRDELRAQNLHDTEEPALEKKEIPPDLDPALREGRTTDGTFNDLHYPKMGSVGCRFGRNVPLDHAFPDAPNLLHTEFGIDYLRKNTMLHVLLRHYPQLAPALEGVTNAFAPWKKLTGPVESAMP